MENSEQFEFVRQLGRDIQRGEICLPSLPAVVVKIRDLLEQESCDFDRVSKLVSADAALVSRLFVFANSAYHNQTGEEIKNLDAVIARLGLDLVKNTAVSIAVRQLLLAEKHKDIVDLVREIWGRSMRLSSMTFAVAKQNDAVHAETAFMCGLLHDVGKLYILTKAKDFPEFLGDSDSLSEVLDDWHPQVGRCVVESWDFPTDVVESMDPGAYMQERPYLPPKLVDVVYVADLLLEDNEDQDSDLLSTAAFRRLRIDDESKSEILARYEEKLASVRQTLN